MLVVETIGRIRREHLVKGKSIKEIARDLKISRNTVRKILRSGETSFSYEREVQPRPRLGRRKADLDRMLTANTETSEADRGRRPPDHFLPKGGTCRQPYVKGLTLMVNSIFNGWRMEDVWLDK